MRFMKRFKLVVAYDGTNYCGWQIQPNGITVEEVLNKTLSRFLKEEIHIIGASRTDSGVHSFGNVAVFDSETTIPPEKLCFALNPQLPEDIRIVSSEQVPGDFHPRYCDTRKTYEYHIQNGKIPLPTERLYSHLVIFPLNIQAMQEASQYLVGTHDFKSFCAAINKGTKTGINFFPRSKIFPLSKSTPLDICAFMILSNSSVKIGINRRAMDIIMAISCTGTCIFFRK